MDFLVSVGICNGPLILTGYPSGGIFSGTGVTGTVFHPEIAGAGTHIISYTNSVDGCNVSNSKSIIVSEVPEAPLTGDDYCCARNVVDLEAVGSNLKWYTTPQLTTVAGWGTPFATGQTAVGTYTYYVTQTINGCESEASQAVLTIYPNTPVGGTPYVRRTPECIRNPEIFTFTVKPGSII